MARTSPIAMREILSLPSLGVQNNNNFRFGKVKIVSEKYIAVNAGNAIRIVDCQTKGVKDVTVPVDSAIMNPTSNVLAMRKKNGQNPNATDIILCNPSIVPLQKLKTTQLQEPIEFWTWIDTKTLAMVSPRSVYHWALDKSPAPVKVFDRHASNAPAQVVSYSASADGKWLCLGTYGAAQGPVKVKGTIQVYSVDHKASQNPAESHAACFMNVKVDGRQANSNLFCMTMLSPQQGQSKLRILEVGVPKQQSLQKVVPFPIQPGDFPVAMIPDNKYGMIFIITKQGTLFMYECQSGALILQQRTGGQFIFTSAATTPDHPKGGIVTIDNTGRTCHFYVESKNLVGFVTGTLGNTQLGIKLSTRFGIGGKAADELYAKQLQQLVQSGQLQQAVQLAATSPGGCLRTVETINLLKQANQQALFKYFTMLLQTGTLNEIESVELVKSILQSGNAQGMEHIHNWITKAQLTPTEELGDLLKNANITLALSVYLRCNSHQNVISCFLSMAAQAPTDEKALESFKRVLSYAARVSCSPDYPFLVGQLARHKPSRAKDFAILLLQHEDGPKLEIEPTMNLFLQQNQINLATQIILKYLQPRGDLEEDGELQTKVLEINLRTSNFNMVKFIFESEDFKFSHYNKLHIASMCEQCGLFQYALEHYADRIEDVKRIMSHHAASIPPQYFVEFIGKMEPADGLEILRVLMRASATKNIRLVVEVAKAHSEKLGANELIGMFEEFQAYNGIYFYLLGVVATSEDPDVIFKFIEAATRLEQFKDVERICKERHEFYNAQEVKDFLILRKLSDPRPLIYVCDLHGYVDELTQYLYQEKFSKFIKAYVQRMNPNATPEVLGALCDLNAPEETMRDLMLGVRPPTDQKDFFERLVTQVERRNRLKLIRPWMEERLKEGSQDVHLHNGLAKIYIDLNRSPQQFLRENQFYDSKVIGAYCETRDPNLALIVYRRAKGACDEDFVRVCNANGFFKQESVYLVQQMDLELWAIVLDENNEFRRQVVDQVVATALPASQSADEVSKTVQAFMAANLPNELIELLERIIIQGSSDGEFAQNSHLQNLLILTAIKADAKRVMNYIDRLDHYDGPDIAKIALSDQYQLYEEAYFIYKKFNKHEECINVLLENIKDITRATEFAEMIEKPEVWSILAETQLRSEGHVDAAIKSFLQAQDPTKFKEVIPAAKAAGHYNEMITYIQMAKQKVRDSYLDNELLYAYAKTDRLTDLEEFVMAGSHNAKLAKVAELCFEDKLYHAAKILYKNTNNNAKLAICLVNLGDFEAAVSAARQAISMDTWKAVCFACVDNKRFRVAAMCGLNIIVMMEHLPDVCDYYEQRGHFLELISLLDQGLNLDRVHQGIYTKLGELYSRYKEDKLMDHIKFYYQKLNMASLLQVCRRDKHWKEVVFLYSHGNQYDNAVDTMIEQSSDCWDSKIFKEVLQNANTEVAYRAIDFYMIEHPLMLNELCTDIAQKLDPSRVVRKLEGSGHLPLVKSYLQASQRDDIKTVNKALNEMYLSEDDYKMLRESTEKYTNFDQIELAQKTEKHDLIEFRRIAAYLYRLNKKYHKSIEVCKRDSLWRDATETAAESGSAELAESLLRFFVENNNAPSFAATLYACYSLIPADVVLELAWRNDLMDFAMPYMIQSVCDFNEKLNAIATKLKEAEDAKAAEEEELKKQNDDTIYEGNMEANLLPQPGMMNPGMGGGMGMAPPMNPGMGMAPPMNPGMGGGMGMGQPQMGMGMGQPQMGGGMGMGQPQMGGDMGMGMGMGQPQMGGGMF